MLKVNIVRKQDSLKSHRFLQLLMQLNNLVSLINLNFFLLIQEIKMNFKCITLKKPSISLLHYSDKISQLNKYIDLKIKQANQSQFIILMKKMVYLLPHSLLKKVLRMFIFQVEEQKSFSKIILKLQLEQKYLLFKNQNKTLIKLQRDQIIKRVNLKQINQYKLLVTQNHKLVKNLKLLDNQVLKNSNNNNSIHNSQINDFINKLFILQLQIRILNQNFKLHSIDIHTTYRLPIKINPIGVQYLEFLDRRNLDEKLNQPFCLENMLKLTIIFMKLLIKMQKTIEKDLTYGKINISIQKTQEFVKMIWIQFLFPKKINLQLLNSNVFNSK
ncbi:unnamed protein product [Paramecium primaurelia]|uniref:Transmembrane protein n=2 Tax=Paramecium primaurelia TaxID=5886 RepID=A0A8S1N568_PARPR|nr:unnamed protein product [Paramecium primaurelia]